MDKKFRDKNEFYSYVVNFLTRFQHFLSFPNWHDTDHYQCIEDTDQNQNCDTNFRTKLQRYLSFPPTQETLSALDSERLFYITENRKIRMDIKPVLCLLCCILKKAKAAYSVEKKILKYNIERGWSLEEAIKKSFNALCSISKNPYPDSHIFPQSLLVALRDIHHGKMELHSFIFDISAGMIGHKQFSFPLLCLECEKIGDEDLLRDVYVQLMAADKESHIQIAEKDSHSLRHVLAEVMFRGAIMGIDFLKERNENYFDKFFRTFIDLRNYCLENDFETYSKLPMANKIHLFFVPNFPFFPENVTQSYVFDLLLRLPQFTTIIKVSEKHDVKVSEKHDVKLSKERVKRSEEHVFLFMKFDCFHCVVPICGGIDFLTDQGSCFTGGLDEGHYRLPRPVDAINYYPDELFQHVISQIGLAQYICYDDFAPKLCIANLQGESHAMSNVLPHCLTE